MKNILLFLVTLLFVVSNAYTQEIARGVVFSDKNKNGTFDANEKGIPNVAISNGVDVVKTNAKGEYKIAVSNHTIIFVIKPSGYNLPVHKDNTPNFYYIHKPNGSPKEFKYPGSEPTGKLPKSVNFGLIPTQESDDFKVILFGDPQPYSMQELEYLEKSVVSEVSKNTKGASFGISLGDIVGDNLSWLPEYKKIMSKIPLPWFNVVGNHDLNFDSKTDKNSNETFEKEFGPVNFSFNYGKAHFIVLDNILWPDPRDGRGYWGGFRLDQLQFIKNDLELVDKDKLIVICMHIPLYNRNGVNFRDEDRRKLFDLLKPFKNILVLTAHTHVQQQFYFSKEVGFFGEKPIHEFNVGTTCGDWFSGVEDEDGIPYATMRDGTPRGYAFLNISGNKYSTTYKAYNKPYDYQLDVYVPKVISKKDRNTDFMVNFFLGGKNTKVTYSIDNGTNYTMERTSTYDIKYTKLFLKWYNLDKIPFVRRPSVPQKSTHIWSAKLPKNLTTGSHKLTIKVTDYFGKVFTKTETIKVID